MAKNEFILATAERWDMISRKWRQRKAVKQVGLYILDHLQMLDATYEVVASRIRIMQTELDRKVRVVALSSPLANAKDVSNWLGIAFPANTFNFHPSVRPTPMEIHIQGFDHNHKAVRLLAMQRPGYNSIKRALAVGSASQGMVFVSDRKQVRLTAVEFSNMVAGEAGEKEQRRFLGVKLSEESKYMSEVKKNVSEPTLKSTLEYGIGFIHDGMLDKEKEYIKSLYKSGHIRLLVALYSLTYYLDDLESHIVLILDPERFDGHENRSVEYPLPDLLHLMGHANLPSSSTNQQSKCLLYCHTPRKDYFLKFLQEPLPLESSMDHSLHDPLNSDIIAGTIDSKQQAVDWITWSFLYRRIS
jgi:pre-mRNA-splicing helicase BRR2